MSNKQSFITFIHDLQDRICNELEKLDGVGKFREDKWERNEGGGGITRVIENGSVFEKGGVNTSVVYGRLPDVMKERLKVEHEPFFACGISLVIHPLNPFVPTVHANYRYFELYDEDNSTVVDSWFGGGADLTPYYLYEEDVIHFHQTLKDSIDSFDKDLYPEYKTWCDKYFYNTHRKENRGVGGIFFDYLREDSMKDINRLELVRSLGNSFLNSYIPIVERRKDLPFTEKEQTWQELRRGRYVEFNLVHDRGTLFGLKTNGRTESILMSLPPRARWIYDFHPEDGSKEQELVLALEPKNWITE